MSRNILFIQGAGRGAYEEDALLVASLRRQLGPGYTVRYPRMPNEDSPEYSNWESQIRSEIASLRGDFFLVGHSLGGSVLMKFIMEHSDELPLAGLFLIASPFWGADEYWKWENLVLPDDAVTRLKGVPVFLYHNRHDDVVPFSHLELYAAKLPGATVREVERDGHQLQNDLTEIAHDIKSLNHSKITTS